MRIRKSASACRAMAVILAAGLILTLAATAHALVVPAAELPLDPQGPSYTGKDIRYHPDTSLNLFANTFNVYTGGSMPADYTLEASLASGFTDNVMWGTMTTQVWQNTTDGTLLFAYQIENTGDHHSGDAVSMKTGNVTGFESGLEFLDCGILDFDTVADEEDGDVAFDQGDVLVLTHAVTQGTEQFGFVFETENNVGADVEKWLEPGETSSWFYFETYATEWGEGKATVQDSGSSADDIPVLVPQPIPEPVTLLGVLAGVGALGGYARRRSRNG